VLKDRKLPANYRALFLFLMTDNSSKMGLLYVPILERQILNYVQGAPNKNQIKLGFASSVAPKDYLYSREFEL
jgi:hypothetical protein